MMRLVKVYGICTIPVNPSTRTPNDLNTLLIHTKPLTIGVLYIYQVFGNKLSVYIFNGC